MTSPPKMQGSRTLWLISYFEGDFGVDEDERSRCRPISTSNGLSNCQDSHFDSAPFRCSLPQGLVLVRLCRRGEGRHAGVLATTQGGSDFVCRHVQANPQFSDARSDGVEESGNEDRCSPCFEIMGFDVFIDEDLRYCSPEVVTTVTVVNEQRFAFCHC